MANKQPTLDPETEKAFDDDFVSETNGRYFDVKTNPSEVKQFLATHLEQARREAREEMCKNALLEQNPDYHLGTSKGFHEVNEFYKDDERASIKKLDREE